MIIRKSLKNRFICESFLSYLHRYSLKGQKYQTNSSRPPKPNRTLVMRQMYKGVFDDNILIGSDCQENKLPLFCFGWSLILFKLSIQLLTMERQEDSFDGTFTQNIRSPTYKNQFASKKNKLIINVSDTQYAVVKHVARKNKWYLQTEPFTNVNFDLCWTDNHVKQEFFARMQPHQKINHFPGMIVLSRKNNLGNALMRFRQEFPGEYEFFPITWNLPNDYQELMTYHQCRQQGKAQTFIVKPEAGCQGRGIYLTRNLEKIKQDRCVVQRYMHKPYLIDGLKFDMRIYVLVAGIDPLRIFVYEEGLARFATEEYRPPRTQNLDNKYMHLTNYAINKDNPKFIFNESVNKMDVGHKRSLTSVFKRLSEQGHDSEQLKRKIYDIFIKTIITGYPTLSESVSSVHPDNFGNDMCFQILGFDIMVDHKLNPYLLEINYTPSFTTDTPLDRYIKKNLIKDTLHLLNINEKWKREMKLKRDRDMQERMVTGKRKKYTPEERIILSLEETKKRNQYEAKNMGHYTKIFITDEEQFKTYKKYYDFAMELHTYTSKIQNLSGVAGKPAKDTPLYNHYFEPKLYASRRRKEEKQNKNILKFTRGRESKQNAVCLNRSGQNQMSFTPSSVSKRVTSAKSGKNHKKHKIINDRISSKKSLRNESYGQNNYQQIFSDNAIDNEVIFHNTNIQKLILKQRQSEYPTNVHDDLSVSHDFN